ncbi:MAG: D-alanine--D-alanine ligase, partial [Alphaproteobacteria bacterium]|nr:D-alanine--D-alanine ligase [Alphaproteobacteria bacterium]
GLKGVAREAQVPALFEAYDIPCVFSDPLTLALALDKAMAKRVVASQGVPTADFAVIEQERDLAGLSLDYPLFAKPVAEGSGKGVDARSLVRNKGELADTVRDLFRRFQQPVLVETYLSGREFTVGITGTGASAEVLGVTEIRPLANYVGHGYGLANKETGWEDKVEIVLADPANAAAAGKVALAAWRALRCRDGGRVDIRCDDAGRHHFIEVNPLAGIRPHHSDLCLMAERLGISYRELIGRIMASFERRQPQLKRRAAA